MKQTKSKIVSRLLWVLLCTGLLTCPFAISFAAQELGYSDTPIIPGTKWHVHDGARPQPPVVTPGEQFSHLAKPPSDATVLFDGSDLSKWQRKNGTDAAWVVEDGYFQVTRGGGQIRTKERFADFQLHIEFATPAEVKGNGQGRGNSGVMINGMYEIQVLDSFNSKTYPDGQCGAIYGQAPPLVNSSKPPGEWQSYDIVFESPRWNEAGELIKKAAATVIHNGVVIHHRWEYMGSTDGIGGVKHKSLSKYGAPHAPEMTIELQDHGNPVRFRNIWVRPIGTYDASDEEQESEEE